MPRQPTSALNTERFMKRVEDRIDRAFDVILDEVGSIKVEVRKGNMDNELLARRMTDLETQVIETREQMQKNRRVNEHTAEVVTNTADKAVKAVAVAADTAAAAPKNVWKNSYGRITMFSAVIVAIIAIGNNAPKLARGLNEVLGGVWMWLIHHA